MLEQCDECDLKPPRCESLGGREIGQNNDVELDRICAGCQTGLGCVHFLRLIGFISFEQWSFCAALGYEMSDTMLLSWEVLMRFILISFNGLSYMFLKVLPPSPSTAGNRCNCAQKMIYRYTRVSEWFRWPWKNTVELTHFNQCFAHKPAIKNPKLRKNFKRTGMVG